MTKEEFVKEMAEAIMVSPEELGPKVELSKFEAWDSTSVLQLIAVLEDAGIVIDPNKIPDCKTVQDVLDLAGLK
ncbi:acyl carrier protein [Paraliomyxa miuraensis]|uniref:acyl carrier protein n=1 Tax=Paraliomyxa miuraensis TaxID=376150 RepID=UPI00225A0E25|nr:acyl carrier protein [Paraliomyxa miuraensis]MCX4246460.1 acyl carrier protein [Paraliomyxa miuraensis]